MFGTNRTFRSNDKRAVIIDNIRVILERTPPELSADILDRGIVLTGGGALLRGLEELIEEKTGINTMTAEDPMKVVAIGTGQFVEFMSGRDGLLHISEIDWKRLETVEEAGLKEGDHIQVKLVDIDQKTGKFKLSRRVLLEKPEGYVERPRRERPERGERRERRPRQENQTSVEE